MTQMINSKVHNSTHQIQDEKLEEREYITYNKLFWLFLSGSIAGVLIEGIFCLLKKGHWESHVVSIFGAINILYGFGAVLFYVGAVKLREKRIAVQVVVLTALATSLELFSGLLLYYGLGMRAWNYTNHFMNYKGLICLSFSVAWGIAAYGMCKVYPYINRVLSKMQGLGWKIASAVLGIIIAIDIIFTGISIMRWSERHYGIAARSNFSREIDIEAPDDWMQSRFIEWRFLE